jgi:hypothetical protein
MTNMPSEGAITAGQHDDLFDLTRFFQGHTRAHGVFENRKGQVRRRFTAEITGTWEGTTFRMDETFRYDDGRLEERTWFVDQLVGDRFTARCADLVGNARGVSTSDGSHMTYTFRLVLKSGHRISVDFDDRMYRVHDDLLLNRATVRKWGFRVGELYITFERVGAGKDIKVTLPTKAFVTA